MAERFPQPLNAVQSARSAKDIPAVFADGMAMNLSNRCPLDGLSIIDNQQTVFTSFFVQAFKNFNRLGLN